MRPLQLHNSLISKYEKSTNYGFIAIYISSNKINAFECLMPYYFELVNAFEYYLSKFKILDKGMLPFVAIKIPNHEMLNMLLQLCKYLEYLTL